MLGLLVGFEVISKVPATLHTPLMSGANAIHGVVLVGVMLLALTADGGTAYALCFLAAVFAATQRRGRLRGDRPDARDVPGPVMTTRRDRRPARRI